MARTDNLEHFLTDVANAIRTKGETVGTIAASNFDTAIANLPEGTTIAYETGIFTPDADTQTPTVNFSKTHSSLPIIAFISRDDDNIITSGEIAQWLYFDYTLGGIHKPYKKTSSGSTGYSYTYCNVTTSGGYTNASTGATSYSSSSQGIGYLPNTPTPGTQSDKYYARYYINESYFTPRVDFITGGYIGNDVYLANIPYRWTVLWIDEIQKPTGTISITQNGTGIDVSSYASADVNVPSGADLNDYFNEEISCDISATQYYWYNMIKKVPDITLLTNDSGNLGKTAEKLFYNCFLKLNEIPKITNVSNVVNFKEAFCQFYTDIDIYDFSSWQFSNRLFDLSSMFKYNRCKKINLSSLGQLQVRSYNTKSNLQYMFDGCSLLEEVDLSNLSTIDPEGPSNKTCNTAGMFRGCTSLTKIDMSSFDFTKINSFSNMFQNVPTNCLIYVKDQDQVDWFTTNFSDYTNVQIKSQYIANQNI